MVRSYVQVGLAEATPGAPALDEIPPMPQNVPVRMRKRRRNDEDFQGATTAVEVRIYCPCTMCARRDEPIPRLQRIVEDHLRLDRMSNKWKVSLF